MPQGEPQNIYEMFKNFSWENYLSISSENETVKIEGTEDFLVKKRNGFIHLSFYLYDKDLRRIEKRDGYINLHIHQNLNPIHYIEYWNDQNTGNSGYSLSKQLWIFRKIFEGVKNIKISPDYARDIQLRGDTLLLKPQKYKEVFKTVDDIGKTSNQSRLKLITFLVNKSKFFFLNKRVKARTLTTKGDFDFLVSRFNLSTKRKKEDYTKNLNKDDILSLQDLFEGMIINDVFADEYLLRLDNYFIKQRLEEIISLGRTVLNKLKTEDIRSKEAKQFILTSFGTNIGQLETVWQKYFEKYLLYLFFSYKKIVPKVEFKELDNLEKKYPDFVGVNHYDGVDVIEIKTHLKAVLTKDPNHHNFAFSSEMSKAIIQTINYMDALSSEKFQKTKEKRDLISHLNIKENLHRPRGIIIISSKDKICKNQNRLTPSEKEQLNRDFTKLRNSIHNVQIFTFDEILEIAERYIENVQSPK